MPCPGRGVWCRGQGLYQEYQPDGGMIWSHSKPRSFGRHGSSYGTKMMDGRQRVPMVKELEKRSLNPINHKVHRTSDKELKG